MAKRNRDSRGRFAGNGFFDTVRDRPGASAAVAAGAAGLAAAGAFLWTRRDRIGEAFSDGMDRLSELKAEAAMHLKESRGKRSKGPRGPIAQQEIKAGMATAE